jgi:sec-independent protein translocase protein TatA
VNFGPLEIGIILLIVLVIFGPKRLPQLGRSLGSGMREFKDAVTGKSKDDEPSEIEPPPPSPVQPVEQAQTEQAQQTPPQPQPHAGDRS